MDDRDIKLINYFEKARDTAESLSETADDENNRNYYKLEAKVIEDLLLDLMDSGLIDTSNISIEEPSCFSEFYLHQGEKGIN